MESSISTSSSDEYSYLDSVVGALAVITTAGSDGLGHTSSNSVAGSLTTVIAAGFVPLLY